MLILSWCQANGKLLEEAVADFEAALQAQLDTTTVVLLGNSHTHACI